MGTKTFEASPVALTIPFDNSTNGFTATEVQSAIEEVKTQVVTNLYTDEATATADTTTTSATYVLMDSMTKTPPAGTYLVWFSTTVEHSNQSVAVNVSLYVGGVQDTDTERSPVTRTNAIGANACPSVVAINAKVVVNGSQAIEVRWNRASAGTATARERTMDILRVA